MEIKMENNVKMSKIYYVDFQSKCPNLGFLSPLTTFTSITPYPHSVSTCIELNETTCKACQACQ